jgi:PAS domain-containing protein
MMEVLPVAIYTTDADGRLTYFNPAAVKLSGGVPQLSNDHWCVTWKCFFTTVWYDSRQTTMSIRQSDGTFDG